MKANEIIEKFKDKYGYVKNIDKVINYLRENCQTEDELNDILFCIYEWNKTVYESLRIKKKEKFSIKEKERKTEEKENIPEQQEKRKTHIIDVDSYMSQIVTCTDTDFITDILPSKHHSNFDNIILSIILEIYHELNDANNMLKDSKDEDEINYLLEEVSRYKNIIQIIKNYNEEELKDEEAEEEEKTIPSKLVYLTNSQNIPYALNDIDNINIEDFEYTLKLLQRLITRNIVREKRFHNSEDLTEIIAIRKEDIRIIYTRGQNDTIIVLGIFVKRLQNTSAYQDFIRRRAKTYKQKKKEIREKIENPEYIEENEKITQQCQDLLVSKKGKIKHIAGDNNGTTTQ